MLGASGAGSKLSITSSATAVNPNAGSSGLEASAGGMISATSGKLTVNASAVSNAFVGPVISRSAGSSITLQDIDAISTSGSSTSVLGARDGGVITVNGVANIHLDAGDYNTAIDSQNQSSGNATIHLGTATLITQIAPSGGGGGAAIAAESTGGGIGALVTANGPVTIRTDSVAGLVATSGNAIQIQGVDIQTGVTVTAPFTANSTPSSKTNISGQAIFAVDTRAGPARITFTGGKTLSHVRRGIEARGDAQITSNGDTSVTVTASGSTAATDGVAGQAAVLAKGTTASYTNNGALSVVSQGDQSDGITVIQGAATVTGALLVDVTGAQGAPASPASLCSTGAGVCLEGVGARFSGNASGAQGSGHIASTGYALQMSAGTGQNATIGGTALSTSGTLDLISVQNAAGTITLTNSTAQAGSNGVALAATGSSTLAFTNDNTQITGDVAAAAGSAVAMALNNGSALKGVITAAKADIDASSRWDVRANATPARLNNAGAINYPAPSGSTFTTVTSTTDYGSLGGSIAMHTQLGDDSAPSDLLVVQQDVLLGTSAKSSLLKAGTAAPTTIAITNAGGAGAATAGNGILVVQVAGASPAGAFALATPVTAGAYTYALVQVGSNWYLQSKLTPLVPPTIAGTPPNGTVGSVYTGFTPTLGPTNATQPITLTLSAGSLPPGLSIDLATGTISGTPTQAGTYTLTITATNAAGAVDLPITIVVSDAPVTPTTTPAPVPGLGGWGIALLAAALAGLGRKRLRRMRKGM